MSALSEVVVDVNGELRRGLAKKHIFFNFHFQNQSPSSQPSSASQSFHSEISPRSWGLCYFSVTFVNCIYFPVRIHSGSLYLDAELISHTQTPAHGHPADHSQAAKDDQRPGLQEGCQYSPKQLNHLLQARGSLPDLAHWFIVTRRNPARRQGSGRMQGRTFSGQPRMPTLAGKRLPSLLVCPQSLGVL